MRYLITYLTILNLIGLLSMGLDKWKAKVHAWRVSEKFLILIAILGGSLGSLLGMHLFHHKTRHPKFIYGIPAILIFQLGACCLWLRPLLNLL